MANRSSTIARLPEQLDQSPLPRFIEWIEVNSTSRRLHRPARIAAIKASRHQTIEHVADRPLDAHGTGCLPIVERRAIAEREAGQERPARQRGGPLQVDRSGRRRQPLEFSQVDGGGRLIQRHLRPPDDHPHFTDRRS